MVSDAAPKIAIDARLVGGQSTGDSTYWLGLIYGLSRVNANFRYLLFSNVSRPAGIPDSERFEWVRLNSRSSRLWSLVHFPLNARRMGASAIHTQYTLSPLAGGIGITTVHDVSFFIGPEWFKPKDRAILRAAIPDSIKRAAKVITVSETSRREIEQYIPEGKGKIRVTPLAAHPGLRPMKKATAKQIVKKALGISEPFMLTVGTKWPRKNLRLAVDATRLLPEGIPHKLLITGKNGWGNQGTADRVIETGYVGLDLLSALYSGADIYLAPSRHEGFGIPLLEAFESGCPVLCSSGGALPEVAGDSAEIEATWEPASWARSIQDLLSDSGKLELLRSKGIERARRYTWEETARKTLEVYKEVAG